MQDAFDGLSERDAARLRAALGQAQPTPGMETLALAVFDEKGDRVVAVEKPVSERDPTVPIRSSDVLPGKRRGRRT